MTIRYKFYCGEKCYNGEMSGSNGSSSTENYLTLLGLTLSRIFSQWKVLHSHNGTTSLLHWYRNLAFISGNKDESNSLSVMWLWDSKKRPFQIQNSSLYLYWNLAFFRRNTDESTCLFSMWLWDVKFITENIG